MTPRARVVRRAYGAVACLLVCLTAMPAMAADLYGTVRNTADGTPIEGAIVRVNLENSRLEAATSSDGFFYFDVPDAHAYDVTVGPPPRGERATSDTDATFSATTWRRQPTDTWLELQVLAGGDYSTRAGATGVPGAPLGVERESAILMKRSPFTPTTLPYPETIRVKMYPDGDFRQPSTGIDTVPFEEYVAGSVYAEIGVFAALPGGPESAAAVFRTFAVASRSYALWFYLRDPDASYHIDNTARNQRFEHATTSAITAAVLDTAGIIMTSATDSDQLDKLEYAASCGRTDTLPEYGSIGEDLISDRIPETDRACVRSWCGHDACAAHQEHPDYPDRGRCLVRGICQWGAAERSVRGETWQEILAHYQPNVQLTDLDAPLTAPLVGFVRAGTIDEGEPVPDAIVVIDDREPQRTDENGFYEFSAVPVGEVTVLVFAEGFVQTQITKIVEYGVQNWASVAMETAPPDPELDAGDTPDGGGPSDGIDSDDTLDGWPDLTDSDGDTPPDDSTDGDAIDGDGFGDSTDPDGTTSDASGDASGPDGSDVGDSDAAESPQPGASSSARDRGCATATGSPRSTPWSALLFAPLLLAWRRRTRQSRAR